MASSKTDSGSESRLNIVQILSPTVAGGLERVVESLAIGHHRRGHRVTVATLLLKSTRRHPFVQALRGEGVAVEELRTGNRDYLGERAAVRALLRRVKPDVAHTHGYRRDILHRPIAAGLGIPTVTTVHGPSKMGGLTGAFFEWLQRRNYRRFDAVVAVSHALHAETLSDGVDPDRLHFIANAWGGHSHLRPLPRTEARETLGLPPEASVVGWVGRLIPVKGGDVLLDAVHRLREPRPTVALIGYGPDLAALRRRADDLGLGDVVRFYPEIRDAGRYFAGFDTFVLSSRSEGLPLVVLEAMAAGTPIVATRVGGIPEALDDDSAALVPSDDPEALAGAIAASLLDSARASARAQAARRRLEERYGLDAFLDAYEHVYRGVI